MSEVCLPERKRAVQDGTSVVQGHPGGTDALIR